MDIKEMEAVDYDIMENVKVAFREIWKKKIIVILATIIGFLVALVYVGITGRVTYYGATATVFSAAYGSYEDSSYGVSAMNTYADIIGSSRVCERAEEQLKQYNISSEQLKDMVAAGSIYVAGASSDSKSYGYKLYIFVNARSPERVVAISNAMANSFANELNDFLGTSTIQVMDEADSYYSYQSINLPLYIMVFGAAAFVLSCGVIFVFAFFSPWVKSIAQCEMDANYVLGIIPYTKEN